MMYHPTKMDHAFCAHIKRRGKGTLVSILAAKVSHSKKSTQMRLKTMVDAGYLAVDKSAYRGWVWTIVPGAVLPPWTSQTGPKGPRLTSDPMGERIVTRMVGTVPTELLARLTLAGLVEQQISRRAGT